MLITGWLSPKGVFYVCNYGEHNDHAELHADAYCIEHGREYHDTWSTSIESKNWIRIQHGNIWARQRSSIGDGLYVTVDQFRFIKMKFDEYCLVDDIYLMDIRIIGGVE